MGNVGIGRTAKSEIADHCFGVGGQSIGGLLVIDNHHQHHPLVRRMDDHSHETHHGKSPCIFLFLLGLRVRFQRRAVGLGSAVAVGGFAAGVTRPYPAAVYGGVVFGDWRIVWRSAAPKKNRYAVLPDSQFTRFGSGGDLCGNNPQLRLGRVPGFTDASHRRINRGCGCGQKSSHGSLAGGERNFAVLDGYLAIGGGVVISDVSFVKGVIPMIFFRKRPDFYKMLLDQARKVEEGMIALVDYIRNPALLNGRKVLRLEEDADDLRAHVEIELNNAFVTPIDREDIHLLSCSVDDIIDYAKSTVEEMMALQVKPNDHMLLMAEGLCEAARAIAEAIACLEEDRKKATELVVYAKKRENYVEHCYREALVELFKMKNVVAILKVREIYRHMSNAADRGDEAANIIGNILVKSA